MKPPFRRAAPPPIDPAAVAALRTRFEQAGRIASGRPRAIRHVSAGSCGGCEIELAATRHLRDGLSRYGLSLVESPRHADILLVTGAITRNMAEALRQTRAAMTPQAYVIAAGDCAIDGGVLKSSPTIIQGGAGALLAIDLVIPGCPPPPERIIEGLLILLKAARG